MTTRGGFRFRAAAALEMRRRAEDAAAAVLARKEAETRAVEDALAMSERARLDALATAAGQAAQGIDAVALEWHRNWIVRLQAAVAAGHEDVCRARDAANEARRQWQVARQRRLALERLRDRAVARHRAEEHRREAAMIDEAARMKFAAPDPGAGE